MKCTYRSIEECRMPARLGIEKNCQLCLMGQQCDEISLLTSAVMNLSIENTLSIMEDCNNDEKLIRE